MADANRGFAGELTGILRSVLKGDKSNLFVAVAVVALVMVLIIPIPAVLLDILMSFNLIFSIFILLLVLYNRDPLDFSVFPSILLILTVFGLALNISSTRLILSQGTEFKGAMVRGFSTFVTGSGGTQGIVIGFIIFIILIIVQVLVITKGSSRISEVAARFALDAMPNKMMAVETELSSGAITEEEAKKKRNSIQNLSSFFGAMDGASKFVSGNVKVGIVITVINIIGGIIVGTTIHGEPFQLALSSYVKLTIGDGLVSQLPALIISVSTGLIVTRSNAEAGFGEEASQQLSGQPKIFFITAFFLLMLCFIPKFPWYVLLPMAILMAFVGFRLQRNLNLAGADGDAAGEGDGTSRQAEPVVPTRAAVEPPDQMSLEIGFALIPLVDREKGADLLDRITKIRKQAALDLGLNVPPIRISDNMRLEPSEYSLKIKGVEIGRGDIRMEHYMAINPGGEREPINGEATVEPAFNLPAIWIQEGDKETAERAGYTVVDPPSIVATHLNAIIKQHAANLLGRQEVQVIVDAIKEEYSTVVNEVMGVGNFTVGKLQKVLQGLLREQVSIRDMVTILETIGDYIEYNPGIDFMIEKVRQSLGRQICLQYCDEDKTIHALTISREWEQIIVDSKMDMAGGQIAALGPELYPRWKGALERSLQNVIDMNYLPVIVTREECRALIRSLVVRDHSLPEIAILSASEIPEDMQLTLLGEIAKEEDY